MYFKLIKSKSPMLKLSQKTYICSRYISEGNEIPISKRYLHSHIHSSTVYNSQDIETNNLSVQQRMNGKRKCGVYMYVYTNTHTHTLTHICIYNGILFSHKIEGNLAICSSMDWPWGHYAKWNKSDRERQVLYNLTHIWNLRKPNSKKQRTDWPEAMAR